MRSQTARFQFEPTVVRSGGTGHRYSTDWILEKQLKMDKAEMHKIISSTLFNSLHAPLVKMMTGARTMVAKRHPQLRDSDILQGKGSDAATVATSHPFPQFPMSTTMKKVHRN